MATGKGAHSETSGKDKTPKGKSHIHQARGKKPAAPPAKGPMADMLKKLFGNKD